MLTVLERSTSPQAARAGRRRRSPMGAGAELLGLVLAALALGFALQ